MRVCHPGPVARQREITSAGKRKEMSCLGLADLGRPPFLATARLSISSVSSGSSLYSTGLTTCASTRERSEPKVRGEACLFTIICLSHTKNVAHRATRGVANHHHTSGKQAVADDRLFTIVLARIFNLNCQAFKHSSAQGAERCGFRCARAYGNSASGKRLSRTHVQRSARSDKRGSHLAPRHLHFVQQDRSDSFSAVGVGVGPHRLDALEHVFHVAGDGDFLHGEGDAAALDPKAAGTA